MFADSVVVPTKLRKAVFKQLHSGYPSIYWMKAIARKCSILAQCGHRKDSQELCPLQKHRKIYVDSCWTYPEQPRSQVHVDFAAPINGLSFLVVVDAHSKWPEIFLMKNTDTHSIIIVLRWLFSQYGQPVTLVSDNGTQFTLGLFSHFFRSSCITHLITTLPSTIQWPSKTFFGHV